MLRRVPGASSSLGFPATVLLGEWALAVGGSAVLLHEPFSPLLPTSPCSQPRPHGLQPHPKPHHSVRLPALPHPP